MGTMKEKRTIQTVQKSIAAVFWENRRMPSFAEMMGLLGVRSKSVVNFWIDKLIEAEILEKDDKGHLKFRKRSFAIPLIGDLSMPAFRPLRKRPSATSCPWMNIW
jgi:hypothetical protein